MHHKFKVNQGFGNTFSAVERRERELCTLQAMKIISLFNCYGCNKICNILYKKKFEVTFRESFYILSHSPHSLFPLSQTAKAILKNRWKFPVICLVYKHHFIFISSFVLSCFPRIYFPQEFRHDVIFSVLACGIGCLFWWLLQKQKGSVGLQALYWSVTHSQPCIQQ